MLKKFAALFCALTVAFAFTSCEPEQIEVTKLSKPILDVQTNGSDVTFVWKEVKNAASYVYTLNDGEEATTSELSAAFTGLENGEYTFKVKACPAADAKEFSESDFASIIVTVQALPEGWFTQELALDETYPNSILLFQYTTMTEIKELYWALLSTEEMISEGITDEMIIKGFKESPEEFTYDYLDILNEDGQIVDMIPNLPEQTAITYVSYAVATNGQTIFCKNEITTAAMPARPSGLAAYEGTWDLSSSQTMEWSETDGGYAPSFIDEARKGSATFMLHPYKHDQMLIFGLSDLTYGDGSFAEAYAQFNETTQTLDILVGDYMGGTQSGAVIYWTAILAVDGGEEDGELFTFYPAEMPAYSLAIEGEQIVTKARTKLPKVETGAEVDLIVNGIDLFAFDPASGQLAGFMNYESFAGDFTFSNKKAATSTASLNMFTAERNVSSFTAVKTLFPTIK